ncbi:Hypothetical Protein FCC1311_094052 [Hondaea fermentalgiana]|uniref:Uncharacterized protein n=1 Tax=Hondaea fermentalgiana TaxID=2315210 RepID=A0A2R5GXN5_9STRA|nr:Hypothetical Protein FCC1311_094052 [Hondaea fermentalgiana]|eukprot:GBG33181.1 Hypothetical Protein FCC1311_094052 [Hondaea fermentalgiana]
MVAKRSRAADPENKAGHKRRVKRGQETEKGGDVEVASEGVAQHSTQGASASSEATVSTQELGRMFGWQDSILLNLPSAQSKKSSSPDVLTAENVAAISKAMNTAVHLIASSLYPGNPEFAIAQAFPDTQKSSGFDDACQMISQKASKRSAEGRVARALLTSLLPEDELAVLQASGSLQASGPDFARERQDYQSLLASGKLLPSASASSSSSASKAKPIASKAQAQAPPYVTPETNANVEALSKKDPVAAAVLLPKTGSGRGRKGMDPQFASEVEVLVIENPGVKPKELVRIFHERHREPRPASFPTEKQIRAKIANFKTKYRLAALAQENQE